MLLRGGPPIDAALLLTSFGPLVNTGYQQDTEH